MTTIEELSKLQKKYRMDFLRDKNGEIINHANDFFQYHSFPVSKWLVMKNLSYVNKEEVDDSQLNSNAEELANFLKGKCDLYSCAYNMYLDLTGRDKLRHEPYAIDRYDFYEDVSGYEVYFIFKEENNGNTYIIKSKFIR